MKRKWLARAIAFGMIAVFLGIAVMVKPSNQVFAEQTELVAATGQAQSAEKAERTVMLYLCGSDLETGVMLGTHNLKQILGSNFSSQGNVKFIVMTDGVKRWHLGQEYLADPDHVGGRIRRCR